MNAASTRHENTTIPRVVRMLLLLAATTAGADCWAQRVADGSASTPNVEVLEEVLVTAERRSTSLQQTAISASVLTGEDLQKKGINTVDALQYTTPALTVQNTG